MLMSLQPRAPSEPLSWEAQYMSGPCVHSENDHLQSERTRQDPSPPLHPLLHCVRLAIGTTTYACKVLCEVTQCKDPTSASGIKCQVHPAARRYVRLYSQLTPKWPVLPADRDDAREGQEQAGLCWARKFTTFHAHHYQFWELSPFQCAVCLRAQSFSLNLMQTDSATGLVHYMILRIPFQMHVQRRGSCRANASIDNT
jgi:hypothetical protein